MNINILGKMNKVPGGLIIIPLLVAILINTFAPQVLSTDESPNDFGKNH